MSCPIENVLVLMDPLVLLKIEFSAVTLTGNLNSPKLVLVDVEVHLRINIWKELSFIHDVWNDVVVELLIE